MTPVLTRMFLHDGSASPETAVVVAAHHSSRANAALSVRPPAEGTMAA
jgi:hypothetical protein